MRKILRSWCRTPLGFFFAFWSWIGFQATAIYGEETVDPKKSVPRATFIGVTTLGVFYTFISYAAVVGFGVNASTAAVDLAVQYFFEFADTYSGHAVRVAMDFVVVTGFFACSFAFHNDASRYRYSLGRDKILPSALGRTHPVHKSPHVAATVQAVIAIVTVMAFAIVERARSCSWEHGSRSSAPCLSWWSSSRHDDDLVLE